MPNLTNFEQITPFFHVADLDATVRFFTQKLGFDARVHAPDYAYLHRETAGIRLLLRADAAEFLSGQHTPDRRYAYIDIRDADTLYAELRANLTTELRNNPDGPHNLPYGQREFTVFAPEHIVLFFGQPLN